MKKQLMFVILVGFAALVGFVRVKSIARAPKIGSVGVFGKLKPIKITKEDTLAFRKAEELRKAGKDYSEYTEAANRYVRAKCAKRSQDVMSGRPVTMDTWHMQWCGFDNPYQKAMMQRKFPANMNVPK